MIGLTIIVTACGSDPIRSAATMSDAWNLLSSSCITGKTARSFIDHAKSPHSSQQKSTARPVLVYVRVPTRHSLPVGAAADFALP
jgi:hypothetical protein